MGCSALLHNNVDHWISDVAISFGHRSLFLAEMLAVKLGLKHG